MVFAKLIRPTVAFLGVLTLFVLAAVGYYDWTLPEIYYTRSENIPAMETVFPVVWEETPVIRKEGESRKSRLLLFGVFPIKNATLTRLEEQKVIPGGEVFGMKLFSSGVMVTGFSDITSRDGSSFSPAARSGLSMGDIILSVNGEELDSNGELIELVKNSGGKALLLSVLREETAVRIEVSPKADEKGIYRLGVLVKDSSAGIGTVTFYEPVSGLFAGLGHPICESETGTPIPLRSGEAMPAEIERVNKGSVGEAGELVGSFSSTLPIGRLKGNTECGIIALYEGVLPKKEPIQVATPSQVKKGKALIYATVDDRGVKSYAIEIEEIRNSEKSGTRNLVIRITDEKLIQKTGGIVQGMSGSPIIQNGMLVGAVTHVLIGDPTRGYGVFADTMLRTLAEFLPEEEAMAS